MSNLENRFLEFHRQNPHVYILFERFAKQTAKVSDHYSSKAVWERMRWHIQFETNEVLINPDTGNPIKLNNNFTAYYAREFMRQNPQHEGFFKTREVKKL